MAISLSKTGNAIKFTFENNAYYLSNGNIEVPLNSLTLVTDDSDMFTFKKSATNDVFISGRYSDIGMTKSELESYYKENMVGSTGGGSGSGMTSGEVQTMIDESISGKADTSDVQEIASDVSTLSGSVDSNNNAITALNGDVSTLSGKVNTDETILTGHTANTDIHVTASDKQNWNNKSDFSGSYNDLTDKPTIPVVPTNVSTFNNDAGYVTQNDINAAVSGKMDTDSFDSFYNSDYVYYKQETNEAIEGLNSAVSGKMDTSSFNTYSASTDARLSEDEEVTAAGLNALNDALSGKQDTLSAGTNITISGNVISAEGGGKAIEAGRGISVTTGATADTVSFDLPISAGTGQYSVIEGQGTSAMTSCDHAEGKDTYAKGGSGYPAHAEGERTSAMTYSAHAEGRLTKANGECSHAEGKGAETSGEAAHAEGGWTKAVGNFSHAEGNSTSAMTYTSHAEGNSTIAKNESEHASGKHNVSNTGSTSSGNTLFSVGNGYSTAHTHNAIEIRQNGDFYFADTDNTTYQNDYEKPMVRLQDVYGALGGLKLVQISQSDYDNLQNKDASTLYIIT